MTRESRSNSTIYDDQDENYPHRNHGHLALQRSDKHTQDTGAYPEDENDDFLDKENQPAGMVIYEDGQPSRRHARQQPLHQQQQHHSQQFSQDHHHPGDTTMTETRADSGVFEDTRRVGGGGVLDAQDVESASDQENVQPCPSTPPAAGTSAAVDIVRGARDELLLREKYLAQRQSNAKAELMERSRDQRQILQRERQQQQAALARQQPAPPIPTQRDAPGAPVRKRTRKSMEAEEFLQQQQRERLLQQQQQRHPEAQRDASQAQDAERLAQEQARRHRARQAQLQNGGHPTQHAQARDDGQRKRLKGQQQQLEEEQQLQQQQQQQQLKQQQEEMAFQEKYNKMIDAIEYGDVYYDSKYEYRNVTLPKIMLSFIDRRFMEYPDNPYCNILRILSEEEWRAVGITMSQYWDNWMRHDPEPHVLLFRRPVGTGAKMKKETQRLAKEKHQDKLPLHMEASQGAKNGDGPSEQQQQQQQQQQHQQQQHHQQQQQ
ncbi:Cyclin-dependent kinases regulatory subunit (Cell division control protein cks1) [Mortierella alpina]|nr:Cyclin-dependent kinases regulatory subunit (Cell division control protein cks1) [Mortierella alpina]